ncbi:MAG: TrmH family RNA methyltransferase [Hominimerdicola sp.]
MHIISKENPKIKLYLKLLQSKKARREENLFVLEGARLCSDAIKEWKYGRFDIYAAFAAESALLKYSEYVDYKLFNGEEFTNFYTISDEVAEKMSGTKGTQGVFIIARAEKKKFSLDHVTKNGKYIVLDNLQDPGNVGTILRTADAVGVDGVVMCNNCCELYNPKTIRSAMGSVFRVQIFSADSLDEVCEIFKLGGIKTMAAVVDSNAKSITDTDFSGGCAVVVGNEGNGLSNDDANACDEKITIKMHGNINSLNAAMAGGIILWEMLRGDNREG